MEDSKDDSEKRLISTDHKDYKSTQLSTNSSTAALDKQDELQFDTSYSWLVLVVIILNTYACMSFIFSTSGILAEAYPKLLGLDVSITNLIDSVLTGVTLIGTPFGALSVARFGLRKTSVVGTSLFLLGYLSSAFATKLWHLILGYSILSGIGASLNIMVTVSAVPHYFKRRVNAAYAVSGIGSSLAYITLPILMAKALAAYGYRIGILLLLPLTALTLTSPIAFKDRLPRPPPQAFRESARPFGRLLWSYQTPFFLINSYLWNAGHTALIVVLYDYIIKCLGNIDTANLIITVRGLSQGVGSCLFSFLLIFGYRFNHYLIQPVLNVVAGAAAIMMAFYTDEISLYILTAITSFAYAVVVSNRACLCNHLYDVADVDYAFGYLELVGGIASLFGVFTCGLIQKAFGMASGFYYIGGQLIFGGFLLLLAAVPKPSILRPHTVYE